jgi:ubiquinone/menaquinone biosynthesis C-methylase UbiE
MKENNFQTAGRTLDYAAGIYDTVTTIASLGRSTRLRAEAIESMDFHPDNRILDLGCGTGAMTLQIAARLNRSGHIQGIDAAGKMIAVARKNLARTPWADRCHFQQALAEQLPFENESFDYCFSSMFYHHLPMDLKRQSMAEAYRVLRRGGVFLTIDIDRPGNPLMKCIAMAGYLFLLQPAIKENIDGVLCRLIPEAGFDQMELIRRKWDMISMIRAVKPQGNSDV